ncbi:hypothetical protein RINTHM_16270 [Richelia intracellularis HM01]|nr:hypothetical protein RINTHM_16270 [Richelia intracellularis HM01]
MTAFSIAALTLSILFEKALEKSIQIESVHYSISKAGSR